MTPVPALPPASWHGLPCVLLRLPRGDEATVALFGGHVLSWRTADGRERLYLSPRAAHDGRTAIRGGVPVCFPQFAGRGALPKHGFARTRAWRLVDGSAAGDVARARLELADDDATRPLWPVAFALRLEVELRTDALRLGLSVDNLGTAPCSFTAALHTYLRAAPVEACRLRGLEGCAFEDSVTGGTGRQGDEPLAVAGELDRIYGSPPPALVLETPDGPVAIAQGGGLRDTVVWNPGPAAQLADLPPGGYREMLCVEAACIHEPAVVAPGGRWQGWQQLSVVSGGPPAG